MADLRRWPQILREVAEEVSVEAALRLAGRLGGQRVKIPTHGKDDSALAVEVGPEISAVLIDLYGGSYLPIPNFAARLADERRRYVLTNGHLSANDIAAALGITARRVEQIRQESRSDPRQLALI